MNETASRVRNQSVAALWVLLLLVGAAGVGVSGLERSAFGFPEGGRRVRGMDTSEQRDGLEKMPGEGA